jgi:hypothetical protein
MKFSLTLLDKNSDVRRNILENLKIILDKTLNKTANTIEPKIKILLRKALQNEPEYSSLINGDLRREFGIENVSNVNTVIENISNTIFVEINTLKINNTGLSGGIKLNIVPSDLSNITNDQSAFVVDNDRGYSLPWLEWLLFKGGEIIIRNFEVKYGPSSRSRSGDALMVQSDSSWRVPAQFSGTEQNNWITRALSTMEQDILKLIKSEFEKSL